MYFSTPCALLSVQKFYLANTRADSIDASALATMKVIKKRNARLAEAFWLNNQKRDSVSSKVVWGDQLIAFVDCWFLKPRNAKASFGLPLRKMALTDNLPHLDKNGSDSYPGKSLSGFLSCSQGIPTFMVPARLSPSKPQ